MLAFAGPVNKRIPPLLPCRVNTGELVTMPTQPAKRSKQRKQRQEAGQQLAQQQQQQQPEQQQQPGQAAAGAQQQQEGPASSQPPPSSRLNPVCCAVCETEVGLRDATDGVYIFINVFASNS